MIANARVKNQNNQLVPMINAQGDPMPQAHIVINDGSLIKKTESLEVSGFCRTESNELELSAAASQESDPEIEIKFSAIYWSNLQNMQRNKRPYPLEDLDGNRDFTLEFDEYWTEKFNKIDGSIEQKIKKICEDYLVETVLPKML